MGNTGASYHHNARRVFVEAVHNAAPGQSLQLRRMANEGIDQGSRRVSCTRVHHNARWLVDDNDVTVLVNDLQLRRFPGPADRRLRHRGQQQHLVTVHLVLRPADLSVKGEIARGNPVLQTGTGELGQQFHRRLIEATTMKFSGNHCLAFYGVCGDLAHRDLVHKGVQRDKYTRSSAWRPGPC